MSRRAVTITLTIPLPDWRAVRGGCMRALAAFGHNLIVWQERADDRKQLAEMDARMRRDIGVRWEDIRNEVRKPFWRA